MVKNLQSGAWGEFSKLFKQHISTLRSSIILAVIFTCLISTSTYAQDIINTLGPGGIFKIKDATTDFLTLSQATSQVNILKTLRLENTNNATTGIIFKGTDRFIHNYYTGTSYNTFMGVNAGNFALTGNYNTGMGHSSLLSLDNGVRNTAIGYNSLFANTAGNYNTALGYASLKNNLDADYNTALGTSSLFTNSTGYKNSAVGTYSLFSNTSGYFNTAVGYHSMYTNDNGHSNTAVGLESLNDNTTGSYNTALGTFSLTNNIDGRYNTALGYQSLSTNTSGDSNTAAGYYSLVSVTTGYDNTAFGYKSGSPVTTGNNLTCIGYNAQPTANNATNQITLGDNNITSLRCNVTTITSLSDMRDKKNIKDLDLGIDFLMKIKPRIYNWDKREWYENNISNGSKMKEEPTAGFIAQELDEVQTNENAEWLNLVLKDNPEKLEATPGNLLPIMVKAIQDLKIENEQLKIQFADLNEIKNQFAEIQNLKAELKEQIEILKASNNSEEINFSFINKERIEK